MSLPFPNINPIALDLGIVQIRWYGIAYVFSIILGMYYIKFLAKRAHQPGATLSELSNTLIDKLSCYIMAGIIAGGRLGYVLFYNFKYYLHNPIKIFYITKGGMAFHGGLIGVVIAVMIFSKKHNINKYLIFDYLAIVVPIGLFFGRIANFINGELYGTITDVPWGVRFHVRVDGIWRNTPRHPSQLYEAFLEGVVIFAILNILWYRTEIRKKHGQTAALFLILYSIARIVVENYRQPNNNIGYIFGMMTMGQILSIPMLLVGVGFLYVLSRGSKS